MSLAVGIRAASTAEFSIMVGVAAVIGLGAFVAIWRQLRRARLVADTPTARLRSAPQGYVEVEARGLGDAELLLSAPLTGRPCLWYRYKIEKRVQSGKNSHWRTLHKEESQAPIPVADDGGSALVDPSGAEIHTDHKDTWYGSREYPDSGPASGVGRWLGSGRYRYTELRLLPGPLYILGWHQSRHANDRPLATEQAELLRAWKQDPQIMAGLDRDGDGHVDLDEWSQARQLAEAEVQRRRMARAGEAAQSLLCRPPQGLPFIISSQPQQALQRRYRRHALLGLLLSGLALGVLLTLFALRLG